MLLFIAELEIAERNRFNLKRSLLATGHFDYAKMFPEYFSKDITTEEEEDQAEIAGEGVNYDYSGVKWMTPTEGKDQYEKLLDHMLKQGGNGTVTGEQVAVPEADWV